MMKEEYLSKLYYIEGSTLDKIDLSRCHIERAKAVVILSDKFSFDAEHEDIKTILHAMIIKKYLNQIEKKEKDKNKDSKNTIVCMQLLAPESITHYTLSVN